MSLLFLAQFPIVNDINNRVLSARGAMPVKNNSTSDGTADFSQGRENYRRSLDLNPATNVVNPNATGIGQTRSGSFGGVQTMFFSQSTRMASLPSEAPRYQQQKKWIGGNRDSSSVTTRRGFAAIGNGTLNANQRPMSFTSGPDENVRREALVRVRSSGSAVCKKVQVRSMVPSRPGCNKDPRSLVHCR